MRVDGPLRADQANPAVYMEVDDNDSAQVDHQQTHTSPTRLRLEHVVLQSRDQREAAFVDGIWHDDLAMAILDREYLAIQRKGT